MKIAMCVVVVLCILGVSKAEPPADKPPEMNGYFWTGTNPSFRLGWVTGYAKAKDAAAVAALGICFFNMEFYQAKFPNVDSKTLFQRMCSDSNKQFDYDGIAMGQFVDGMNSFYADFPTCNWM